MGIKKLDELQLIKRGNIFKHCLFTVIGLLLINVTLLEFDFAIMSQINMLLCIIQFTISLFCIEMIINEIYPIGEKRMRVIYCFFGLMGVTLAILSLCEVIISKKAMFEDGLISNEGIGLLISILNLSIIGAYIGRKLYNKNHKEGEL